MNEIVSLFNFGSIGLQLFSEENNNCYHHTTHACAVHIDTTSLADGNYELVPESESELQKAQVNLTEATEDPNPISEEPRTSYAQEGKPRIMSFYFKFMQLIIVPIYLCI